MPGAERAEIYFITAMMILILVLCVAAVYFFFRQYKKEMREKEERIRSKAKAAEAAESNAGYRLRKRADIRSNTGVRVDSDEPSGADVYQDEVLSPGARVRDLLDTTHLRALFEEHRAGRTDHSYALWATWVLERWLRTATRAPAAATAA